MARGIFQHVVQQEDGDIQASATVTLYEMNGTTPLAQSVYAASSGGSPIGNVLTANGQGLVEAYVDLAQYIKVTVGGVQTTSAIWPDPGQITTLTGTQTLTNKTLTSPTITGATITGATSSAYDLNAQVYNVRAYGATPHTNTDQTVGIQAALQALLNGEEDEPDHITGGGILYFPPGQYHITEPFLIRDVFGVTIMGAGSNRTWLEILDRDDDWVDLPIVDCSGSLNFRIYNIGIMNRRAGTTQMPSAGLLMVQNGTNAAGGDSGWFAGSQYGPNSTNALEFRDMRIQGPFSSGCLVAISTPSWAAYDCDFYLESDPDYDGTGGKPATNNVATAACVIIAATNDPVGIAVPDLQAGGAYPTYDSEEPVLALDEASDISFFGCEFHDTVGSNLSVLANTAALWIHNGQDIQVYGANMSAGSTNIIRLTGGASGSGALGIQNLLLEGIRFYSEGSPQPPLYALNLNTPAGVTGPAHAAHQVTVRNCSFSLSSDASAAVIRSVPGATWNDLKVVENTFHSSFTGSLVKIASTGATFNRAYLECGGFAVDTGSTSPTDLNACVLINPGTVTPSANTSTTMSATGAWKLGGQLTISGGASNGQLLGVKVLTELTTIAAAATTDTAIQLPAAAIILGVSVRVTTVIPTAATFTVGDSGSAARFSTAAVSVAANTTDPGTKAGAYYNASATAVRITPNAQPAANTGQVRVTIHYISIDPPTS